MIKIILAEDHIIVRNGLKMLLENSDDVLITGLAGNGLEVLNLLDMGTEADVVITDINMPEMDGLSLAKALSSRKESVKVIVLSMLEVEQYLIKAFNAGVSGYILKNADHEELLFCVRTVISGHRYLSRELTEHLIDKMLKSSNSVKEDKEPVELSEREIEVLHLIAEGLTNFEMGERLFLSKRTIEGHRQCLLEKTRSKNTATLIRFAAENGLL